MTEISATFRNLKNARMEAPLWHLLIGQSGPCKNQMEPGEWV